MSLVSSPVKATGVEWGAAGVGWGTAGVVWDVVGNRVGVAGASDSLETAVKAGGLVTESDIGAAEKLVPGICSGETGVCTAGGEANEAAACELSCSMGVLLKVLLVTAGEAVVGESKAAGARVGSAGALSKGERALLERGTATAAGTVGGGVNCCAGSGVLHNCGELKICLFSGS